MHLFIPELGTKLELTKKHIFEIAWEKRNESIFKYFHPEAFAKWEKARKFRRSLTYIKEPHKLIYNVDSPEFKLALEKENECLKHFLFPIGLYKGNVLEVDRIYIRQGNAKYSSVTFKIRTDDRVLRFWLSLAEVNKISCKVFGEPAKNRFQEIPRYSIGG